MEDATLQFIAAQLRKPEGDAGILMGERMNEGNCCINEHTIEALAATGNERILEIGMGNGFFVRQILKGEPGLHYTGCDFSPEMVQECERRNPESI
jgi:cyclopropane fatty-acyl-phospholipid synthase-like methyltransferase